MPLTPPCPRPESGRWKGSLSEGERHQLAALDTANGLLVMLVLAEALSLLSTKLAGPFWLLASTWVFHTNGFLALLAVLLREPLGDAVLERLCQAAQPALAAPSCTQTLRHGGL